MYINIHQFVEVWSDQQYLTTLNIDADSSNVVVDRAGAARRICSFNLTDPFIGTPEALVPTSASSLLAPFGNELHAKYGVQYDDGTVEDVSVGVFQIVTPLITHTGDNLTIAISGADRSRAYSRAGFQDVFVIPSSTNLGLAVQAILQQCNVGFTPLFSFAPTTAVTPLTPLVYEPGDDPWAKATTLCSDNGYQLFHDPDGVCIFQPIPDPRLAASLGLIAHTYDANDVVLKEQNLALSYARSLDTTDAPNFIVRNGEGSGVPTAVQGIAFDNDPASPTYVNGKYGTVVDAQTSSLLVTQAQANLAAASALIVRLGSVEALELITIPKPDHDVDDVILAGDTAAGIASGSLYVFDSLTLTFGVDSTIDAKTRAVTPFS